VIVWLDNHLSPLLATWIAETFAVEYVRVPDFGMARASDPAILEGAASEADVLISKDSDLAELVGRRGPPPSIILLTCGDTSTAALRVLLADRLLASFVLIAAGEVLVEIGAMV